MQIVIDIPEDKYNFVKKQVADGITNPLKMRIANGTPLPKAENNGFIAVCDSMNAVTQELVDKLKNTVFVGDEDCSYCFDIMEIIKADGGDAE